MIVQVVEHPPLPRLILCCVLLGAGLIGDGVCAQEAEPGPKLQNRVSRSDPIGAIVGEQPTGEDNIGGRAEPPVGAFRALPYDENYSALADPARRNGPWERLKYIPLGEEAYLTLGGESRLRFQHFENERFGSGRLSDSEFQHRHRLWGDLRLGGRIRGFIELQSAFTAGREVKPGPADENPVEVHQGFLDLGFGLPGNGALGARVGRQEISLGKQRLVGVRDGGNTRRSFDGVRLIGVAGDWEAGALAVRPVKNESGAFDDGSDTEQALWGGYIGRRIGLEMLGDAKLGLLYLGYDRKDARFDAPVTADERRHTFGTRLSGRKGSWDYDLEANVQWGRFGRDEIRAWMGAGSIGYTFADAIWSPRVGLAVEASSGDGGTNDGRLGTFNPLYAQAPTLSLEFAQPNVIALTPTLSLKPSPSLSVDLAWSPLWRESENDGIYNRTNMLFRSGRGSDARPIGQRFTSSARWQVSRHLQVGIYANYVAAGRFLREAGPSKDLFYVTANTTFRF